MIPEPNLWADLRDRDRSLDEVEYPPHHLEAVNNTRTLTLPRNSNPRDPFLKEELELEPGHGPHSGSAVTVSSAASMNNVNEATEVMRQRQRWIDVPFSSNGRHTNGDAASHVKISP